MKLRRKPFSTAQGAREGLGRFALSRLVKRGVLERLSRGVYQAKDQIAYSQEDLYRTASIRCGRPSAICLLSALEHYNLTDEVSKQIWVMVENHKRIASSQIKVVRARNPKWSIGIAKNRGYWITTVERTLVDCLVSRYRIGSPIALHALKNALSQKKAKLGDILDVAKEMGVYKRVYPYIEALAS